MLERLRHASAVVRALLNEISGHNPDLAENLIDEKRDVPLRSRKIN